MKTEREVREVLDSIRKAFSVLDPQCDCRNCYGSRLAADVLAWVLGEHERAQWAVDALNEATAGRKL